MMIHWYSEACTDQVCRERACSFCTLQPLHLPGVEDILGKPGKRCVYEDR